MIVGPVYLKVWRRATEMDKRLMTDLQVRKKIVRNLEKEEKMAHDKHGQHGQVRILRDLLCKG